MGMTIDEAIRELQSQKRYYQDFWAADANDYVVEMLDVAIDTMRKYQKIEQIVKEWEFDHESMVDSMEKISKEIKNGQNIIKD